MRSISKKTAILLLSAILVITLLPQTAAAYATGDDYPYKNSSISTIDQWRFKARWCTSFVAWCIVSRNGIADFDNFYGDVKWGNASNWGAAAKRLGIPVDDNPAVGSIAWKGTHVAWVAEVNGDEVTIEEYNCINKTEVNPKGKSHVFNRRVEHKSSFNYIHIGDIDAVQKSEIKAFLDGKELDFDAPPLNENGRLLFPVRAILEELGAAVWYDGDVGAVTATKGDKIVVITAGDCSPTINGRAVLVDQPGIIAEGVMFAPLRFIVEAFGGAVVWDDGSQTAYITR